MSNIISRIAQAVTRAIISVRNVFATVNNVASKYGPHLREFVISTAEDLERLIPDHGMGNVKLMAFDGALKVFIDVMRENGEVEEKDIPAIYQFAHLLLEGYLAAKKARNSVEKDV